MLRNACAGAVYESCLKASLHASVASYEVMVFCAAEGETIMELVQKGSLIVAQSMGIVLCLGAGFLTIGWPSVFVVIGVLLILLFGVRIICLYALQFNLNLFPPLAFTVRVRSGQRQLLP